MFVPLCLTHEHSISDAIELPNCTAPIYFRRQPPPDEQLNFLKDTELVVLMGMLAKASGWGNFLDQGLFKLSQLRVLPGETCLKGF